MCHKSLTSCSNQYLFAQLADWKKPFTSDATFYIEIEKKINNMIKFNLTVIHLKPNKLAHITQSTI